MEYKRKFWFFVPEKSWFFFTCYFWVDSQEVKGNLEHDLLLNYIVIRKQEIINGTFIYLHVIVFM